MISAARAAALVRTFGDRRLLVVGDVILDRYVWGSVERISPEAPVPVVRVTRESVMPGGAGNVARNLATLGAQVDLVAVVGEDDTGRELSRLLAEWKIDPTGLVTDAGRPTTVKTRVIARAQQVVRFDREAEDALSIGTRAALLAAVRARLGDVEGVILQDYGKGVLGREVIDELVALCTARATSVFVDPKAEHWDRYRGVALVKPNLREAEAVTGVRLRAEEDLARLGRAVLERTGARTVAITRGAQGISLYYAEGGEDHVPTLPRQVADATGAGDTAIATLGLARVSGASWVEAAALANAAAGVVVEVPGTASLRPEELLRAVSGARRASRRGR
jgi:D-beta-D-heptose 7-phosphate kinase/D-beta-D-heptose 1-phosphate adenosyltransferase